MTLVCIHAIALVGLDDSLSGSASSEDDDDEDSDDAVNTLVKRTGRIATRSPSPDSARLPPLTALVWFHSPPSTQLGLYRSVFPLKTEPKDYVSELMDLQTSKPGGRTWAMFMVAGGHFAGAIVRVSPDEPEEDEEGKGKAKSKKQKRPKPDTEIILHKTFHRYTSMYISEIPWVEILILHVSASEAGWFSIRER